jgi:UDP-GlcNAc:undecaprenyl-phosphate GlcNAc-1-phosphate transferase
VYQQLVAGVLGFLVAFGLMPGVMALARKFRALDEPDSGRRLHLTAVPRLGGVAIFAGTVVGAGAVVLWGSLGPDIATRLADNLATNAGMLPGVFLGCVIVFVTGIVDDLRGVRPIVKLLAQTLAAAAVVRYGFRVDHLTLAGAGTFSLGVFAIPITVVWIVGMTNAFNLIDGIDGLAGTFALIGLAAAMGVDVYLHANSALLVSSAMFGAVFAFLRYNAAPARIFLGDSGSMLLGYFLSIRLVTSATATDGALYALVPLFALAFPLADTFIAIARRWLRGEPLSRADGRHVHHQMLALGLSARRTVELLGLFFFGVAAMGISIAFAPPQVTLSLAAIAGVLVFVTTFYGLRWLGYHEFTEFGSSVTSVLVNARSHVRGRIRAHEISAKLKSASSLTEINALLESSANELGLAEVTVLPGSSHFHGPAARQISPPSERLFRVDYPIAWEEDGRVREIILRLWCERPGHHKHTGAERIAGRLAATLEAWLAQNPRAIPVEDETKRVSARQVPRVE